jgi:carboxypeptidase family protein
LDLIIGYRVIESQTRYASNPRKSEIPMIQYPMRQSSIDPISNDQVSDGPTAGPALTLQQGGLPCRCSSSWVSAGALVQSVAPPTAAISGRVLEEGNRTPISGAQVWLVPSQPPAEPVLPPGQPRTVITDADGRYAFDDVEGGRYSVTAQKPGFALPNGPLLQNVTLAPGAPRQDVNLLLQKGAVIAGRVLDDTGEPVVDVRVMVMRGGAVAPNAPFTGPEGPFVPGGQGQTNDLGEFRLFGLPAGEYVVRSCRVLISARRRPGARR